MSFTKIDLHKSNIRQQVSDLLDQIDEIESQAKTINGALDKYTKTLGKHTKSRTISLKNGATTRRRRSSRKLAKLGCQRWTKAHDIYLRKNAKRGAIELARGLLRTPKAVILRAASKNISLRKAA